MAKPGFDSEALENKFLALCQFDKDPSTLAKLYKAEKLSLSFEITYK